MKITADEHVTALNNAIGKKRLFHIGMNIVYSTKFSSNYVLKKSFKIDNDKDNHQVSSLFPNHLGPVWLEVLKFNKHCNTFVLFDKKFSILD
jgi:hypothetical protein